MKYLLYAAAVATGVAIGYTLAERRRAAQAAAIAGDHNVAVARGLLDEVGVTAAFDAFGFTY